MEHEPKQCEAALNYTRASLFAVARKQKDWGWFKTESEEEDRRGSSNVCGISTNIF